MRLTAYRLADSAPALRPAPAAREWMDLTDQRYAYRCLPLTIANSHGWELLAPHTVDISWTGGKFATDISIVPAGQPADFAMSHFGHGILTLRTGYLFETEASYNLYVTGPINRAKDGLIPLTGIVETDWLPYPFTMNWRFTTPGGRVRFEEGEPFCHIFPVPRGLVENVEPRIISIHDAPELKARVNEWIGSRERFNAEARIEGTEAHKQGWQKNYARGRLPNGDPAVADHQTKLNVRPFVVAARPGDDTAQDPPIGG
jgi:hypothetical protein